MEKGQYWSKFAEDFEENNGRDLHEWPHSRLN